MQNTQQTVQLCAWPLNRIDKAIEALCGVRDTASNAVAHVDATSAGNAGTSLPGASANRAASVTDSAADASTHAIALDQWMTTLSGRYGWEAEPVTVTYRTVTKFLQQGAPAILCLPSQDEHGRGVHLLALQHSKAGRIGLLSPDLRTHSLDLQSARDLLCADLIAPHLAALEPLLSNSGFSEARRRRVQQATLSEMIGGTALRVGWLLRLAPSASLWQQVQKTKLAKWLYLLIGCYLGQLLFTLFAWWLIGGSTLSGNFTWVRLLGWGAALLTTIPIQFISNEAQSQVATQLGALFKQRLLYGALRLAPEEVRKQGAGQFLKRVMAASAVEQLALAGGLIALLSLLQVAIAAIVLGLGAGGWLQVLLLLCWLVCTVALGGWYLYRSRVWDRVHRSMTNDLVERMVGQRTRLAQEKRAHWHDEEDRGLREYLNELQRVDNAGNRLQALVPRGWMVLGLGAFVFTLLTTQSSTGLLAVTLGGVLLARQALSTIILGIQSVVSALLAWHEVTPIFQAAAQTVHEGSRFLTNFAAHSLPNLQTAVQTTTSNEPVLVMRNLEFGYPERGRAILRNCQLRIQPGDRLLLEGPSGGGKSTLAALLAGLRLPDRGTLLLNGLDQRSVGEVGWRRRVVVVPQFHENYVLTGTFAFNLLMGRAWPPQAVDLAEAEMICRNLELGELLERMPLGLQQIVGESGWQLSHGERSRLYIARALLQKSDLIILDESFGALDPETLQKVLTYVLQQSPALLVIMHP